MADVDYSRVTLMFSLPRSRTQWWTWFFERSGINVKHDPLSHHASPVSFAREVTTLLQAIEGRFFFADTAAIFFHDQLLQQMPGLQTLYMLRNPADVVESIRNQAGHNLSKLIAQQQEALIKHAFGRDRAVRLYWGCLSNDVLRSLWTQVTGTPVPDDATLRYFHDHVVDVPLMQQHRDDEKARSLWGYRE